MADTERWDALDQRRKASSPLGPYPDFSPRDTFTHDELGRPYRVKYGSGAIHAVAAGFMVNSNPFTLTAWLRCDESEVSLNAVYESAGPVTCPICAAIETESRQRGHA